MFPFARRLRLSVASWRQRPCLEQLEDRCVPAVSALSLADPNLIAGTAGGASTGAASSADGQFVVYQSTATNLVGGQVDTNLDTDIFLQDRSNGITFLISRASGTLTTAGNAASFDPDISADGRFITFTSRSTNLVPGQVDTAGSDDIFVFDRLSGVTTLASRAGASSTQTANGPSRNPVISDDGNFVAYVSEGTNVVAGQNDTNGGSDVFLFNVGSPGNSLVSRTPASPTTTGDGASDSPVINNNGNFIAYRSDATNLVAVQTDTNNASDVFLLNRTAAPVNLILSRSSTSATTTANAASDSPTIDDMGNFIAFRSEATNVVGGQIDTNGVGDIFAFDRLNLTLSLVSRSNLGATFAADGASANPVLSGAGNYVAFESLATNLFAGLSDNNNQRDVFLHDLGTSTNTLVSRNNNAPGATANGTSDRPVIDTNGDFIAFRSTGTNIVDNQLNTNATSDFFLLERATGNRSLISRSRSAAAVTSNGPADTVVLSNDGRYATHVSQASDLVVNLVDTNGFADVFQYDRLTLTNRAISLRDPTLPSTTAGGDSTIAEVPPGAPVQAGRTVSADGRFVVFVSSATNLAPNQVDTNFTTDIFLTDRVLGTTTLVSQAVGSLTTTANGASFNPTISQDGNYVAFVSGATDLVPGQVDNNNANDVFLYNRVTGSIQVVSRQAGTAATTGNGVAAAPVISNDGNLVGFVSQATNHVVGQADANNADDVFLFNRTAGTIRLISGANNSGNITANGPSDSPSLSGDGSLLAFRSDATNLVPGVIDGNLASDIFLFNSATGTNTLLSHVAGSPLTPASGLSETPVISSDGSSIGFVSTANNLVPNQVDGGGLRDVFLRDRTSNTTALVSHVPGSLNTAANGASTMPSLSVDGNVLAFVSLATNLVTGQTDANNVADVFVFTRAGSTITLASHADGSPTTTANAESTNPVISGNASTVAFLSQATNLVPGQLDNNNANDVFAFNRQDGSVRLASQQMGTLTTAANASSDRLDINGDGGLVLFDSAANDLVMGDRNGGTDVFAFPFNRAPVDITLVPDSVLEKQGVPTLVGTLMAIDPDTLDTFTFTFVTGAGDTDNGSFQIVGNQLFTATVLDAGMGPTRSIRVRATDALGLFVDKAITVNVTDINEQPTDILLMPSSVAENQPTGTTVGTFTTIDPDPANTFTYTFVAGMGSTDNGLFTINGDQLLTNAVFNFEANSTFSIRVRSTDQGGLFTEKALTVTINDANDAPSDILLSNNIVQDGDPVGSVVGTLTAVDDDAGDTFTFSLVAGAGDTNNASFQIIGNQLQLAVVPRLRSNNTLSARIRATDAGGLFIDKVFTIQVRPNSQAETVGMFNPFTATWFLRNSNDSGDADAGLFQFGGPFWQGVVGDWDGDGNESEAAIDTTGGSDPNFAVWYIRNSNTSGAPDITPFAFGLRTWIPVVGDWNGDGVTGIGMYDPFTGTWFLRNTPSPGAADFPPFLYGLPGWLPVVGDWDGNGTDTVGVVDPSTMLWHLRNSNSPGLIDVPSFGFGGIGWRPVTGDWDGDEVTTVGVVNPFPLPNLDGSFTPDGTWFLRNSNTSGGADITPFQYGSGFWTPLSGVYNRRLAIPLGAATLAPQKVDPTPSAPPAMKPLYAVASGDPDQLSPTGVLDPSLLSQVITATLPRLGNQLGLDALTLSQLGSAEITVTDLPGTLLGLADVAGNRIFLDEDAAGHGWFIDPTPEDDVEFALPTGNGFPADRMDLMTVLGHEMGHLVGLEDLDANLHADDLMAGVLAPGQRRLHALDTVFAQRNPGEE